MDFLSSVPIAWRLKKSRYALIGSQCVSCKQKFFPPTSFCPDCRRKGRIEDFQFSGEGVVASHTVIRAPPKGFDTVGHYSVGIIALKEGPKIAGQIVGPADAIQIGSPVKAVFRKLYEDGDEGLISYGMKWQLVE